MCNKIYNDSYGLTRHATNMMSELLFFPTDENYIFCPNSQTGLNSNPGGKFKGCCELSWAPSEACTTQSKRLLVEFLSAVSRDIKTTDQHL